MCADIDVLASRIVELAHSFFMLHILGDVATADSHAIFKSIYLHLSRQVKKQVCLGMKWSCNRKTMVGRRSRIEVQ